MSEMTDLIQKIESRYKKMSKGQKRIADYIMQHYEKAAFMTANKLGTKVGVSESTVVRFADSLGYDGYPHLQKAIQEMIRNKLTTVQLIEMTSELNKDEVLGKVLKSDIDNIRSTMVEVNPSAFYNVVSSILNAKRVYIMGMRSASPLAQFFGYYLDFILSNVRTISSGMSDIFEQMLHIGEGDLFIGLSFPRYSTRTIGAMQFAAERGATCVAITDSLSSPLAAHAHIVLPAKTDMAFFVDSLVAPFSLINALIVAIGLEKKEELTRSFTELENIWKDHNIYASGK